MINEQERLQEERNEKNPCSRIASHRYFTAIQGGLVPNTVSMQEVQRVLDVGCSEGGWVLDLARKYPRIHITGIDADEHIVNEATRYARFHGMSNVAFLYHDATTSLPFKTRTFDFIHARSARFLYMPQRAEALTELLRTLRPGGWLNLVEFEQSATSSLAFDRVIRLFLQMVQSAYPSSVGIATRLYELLLNEYLLDVSYTVHAVDFGSYNTLGAKAFLDEVFLALRNVKPIVCCKNALASATYDALLEEAAEDLQRPDACCFGYLLSATGRKDG